MSQDYIQRLISQLGVMLAGIIAKRRAGQLTEAKQELDDWCSHAVGMSLALVRQMSPQALHQHIYGSGSSDYSRAVLLAELLMQDAEILESEGDFQQALVAHLHAFNLLYDAQGQFTPDERAAYTPKLAALAAKLKHLPPNPYLTEKLATLKTAT
jgi:hypothetical protein